MTDVYEEDSDEGEAEYSDDDDEFRKSQKRASVVSCGRNSEMIDNSAQNNDKNIKKEYNGHMSK
jgi:hypothetical protein